MWVPSDVNITQNEMTDKAADLATRLTPCHIITTHRQITSNHASNKKYVHYDKIIGIILHPLINSKQLRKKK